eukprot:CAMPEP_0181306434 /NCGR_PEP_ID=MMETSP1101-20121128/10298_1 /TAXON_ID=46948 /ORGANISM="Rhodomonas abbreviata, Strain Caron Lab Isolate" /LENGTH=528 /DNA_ID=CAMNT_0023412491 /DNA_START=65 /DNA_END=1648 /DNA_ORIENTATION=+
MPEISVPRGQKFPVPEPKQSAFGTNLNFVPSTTKWALSLRNVTLERDDVYGKPALSVMENHLGQAIDKASKGILNRIVKKYSQVADSKISATIEAFQQHVPSPTTEDYKQLDDVLSSYVKRKSNNRIKFQLRNDKQRKASTLFASATPVPTPITDDSCSRGIGRPWHDVRKDEWYEISMLKDTEAQERDRRERKLFLVHAKSLRNQLKVQEHQLEKSEEEKLEKERIYAAQEKAQQRQREAEDKKRNQERIRQQIEKKERADREREEVAEKTLRLAMANKEQEQLELKRTRMLIHQDKIQQEQQLAQNKRDMEETRKFNIREEERKRLELIAEMEKEKLSIKDYEALLKKRELQREKENEERLAIMRRQADGAEARHQEGLLEDEEIERRAAEVQRKWAKKRDEEEARLQQQKERSLKEAHSHIALQLQQLRERDMEQKNVSKLEAATAKQLHLQAVRGEEERVQRQRERNLQHRRELEDQIRKTHMFLKGGCGERGMTEFEEKYNSLSLSKIKARQRAGSSLASKSP